jgi:hypothetical protein
VSDTIEKAKYRQWLESDKIAVKRFRGKSRALCERLGALNIWDQLNEATEKLIKEIEAEQSETRLFNGKRRG